MIEYTVMLPIQKGDEILSDELRRIANRYESSELEPPKQRRKLRKKCLGFSFGNKEEALEFAGEALKRYLECGDVSLASLHIHAKKQSE